MLRPGVSQTLRSEEEFAEGDGVAAAERSQHQGKPASRNKVLDDLTKPSVVADERVENELITRAPKLVPHPVLRCLRERSRHGCLQQSRDQCLRYVVRRAVDLALFCKDEELLDIVPPPNLTLPPLSLVHETFRVNLHVEFARSITGKQEEPYGDDHTDDHTDDHRDSATAVPSGKAGQSADNKPRKNCNPATELRDQSSQVAGWQPVFSSLSRHANPPE